MKVTDNGIAVWCCIRRLGGYRTNEEIVEASGMDPRSVRWQTYRLLRAGLLRSRPVATGLSNAQEYTLSPKPPASLVERADEHDAVASFRAKLRKQKKAG